MGKKKEVTITLTAPACDAIDAVGKFSGLKIPELLSGILEDRLRGMDKVVSGKTINKNGCLTSADLKWFRIEKYDFAKEWGLGQWVRGLYIRYMLLNGFEQNWFPDADAFSLNTLQLILNNPGGVDNPDRSIWGTASRAATVRDQTVLEAYEQRLAFDRNGRETAANACEAYLATCDKWFQDKNAYPLPDAPEVDEAFDDLLTRTGRDPQFHHVAIELNASDEILIQDFKLWLAERRLKAPKLPRKAIEKSDLQDWVHYRVLPYIDLHLFSLATMRRIKDSTMGEILFPNEYDVNLAERVRKVVREQYVNKIMQGEFLDAIEKQVSRAEANK